MAGERKKYEMVSISLCGGRCIKKEKQDHPKLKIGAGMIDVWVITEAANGEDQFDILSSAWLKQRAVRKKLPMIYGIAKGYEEAVDLVVQMAEETYRETGNGDILRYLKSRCSERQGRLM